MGENPIVRFLWVLAMVPVLLGAFFIFLVVCLAIMAWPYWIYKGVCGATGWC